jgi:photosystem II stability/assembly factor-like uncharacterized protein
MKNYRSLLIIVILFFIFNSLVAQQWIAVSPQGYNIGDASFSSEQNGWFLARDTSVWYQYSLMKTKNGGESWDTTFTFPNGANVQRLQMVDSLHGFLKFDKYPDPVKYMRTIDGGLTWEDQGPLSQSNHYFFVNADTGFCDVGHDLYKTTDAGLTWSNIELPADPDPSTPEIESYGLFNIFFVDELHGWICGNGWIATYIFYTSDGGNSWQVIDQVAKDVITLNFSDTLHGSFISATGYHNLAYSTSDNFLNKKLLFDDIDVYSIYAQNDSTTLIGFINQNAILRTTDFGQSFDTLIPIGFETIPFTIAEFKFFGSTGYAYGSYIFKYVGTLNTAIHPNPAAEDKISLYPNPADNIITIEIAADKPEKVTIELYSPEGKCLLAKSERLNTGVNHIMLSVKSLRAGIYFVRLNGNHFNSVRKLIIER